MKVLRSIIVLLLLTPSAQAATTIYVSPTGNDNWSGQLAQPNTQGTDGPVATLQRARDILRQKKSGDELSSVIVADGRYPMTEPSRTKPLPAPRRCSPPGGLFEDSSRPGTDSGARASRTWPRANGISSNCTSMAVAPREPRHPTSSISTWARPRRRQSRGSKASFSGRPPCRRKPSHR